MDARWSADAYASLEETLRKRAGLVFQALRRQAVEGAATRVMRRIGIASPELFLPMVQQDGAVFDDLMAEVTIGETYFFREPAHFALLRQTIIPEFRARHAAASETLHAWSAGSSTGEEAYSLSIAMHEMSVPSVVIGTDVSRARLAAARRAQYRRWSFRGVPESVIDRYFRREPDDTFTLVPSVRRDVEFRYLNLASDCYPSMSSGVWGMDVILCRNVLIYFDRETIARVAQQLYASLADDGWILLGATDPPLSEYIDCEVVAGPHGLAYRRRSGARTRAVVHANPVSPTGGRPAAILADVATTKPETKSAPNTPREPSFFSETDQASSGIARAKENHAAPPTPPTETSAASSDTSSSNASARAAADVRDLANAGRLEEAGRACAAALDRFRDSPELHYLHAILLAHAGQFIESARAAKRALYLDRSMVVAQIALGTALMRAGQSAAARRALGTAIRLLER
ncbi:MAG TPA: CheR family methyltransferase, partial [Gemmatimonadaceae bacterium]